MGPAAAAPARDAYEALAPFYDALTAGYEYERWLAQIEATALGLGLSGRRVLDIGCGTGKSFLPLLERGYDVTACDLSPAMVERARARAGDRADVIVADMRALPRLGAFDLITCLDDGLNYLLSRAELDSALVGVTRNLSAGGLFVFDLNSLATFRTAFAASEVIVNGGVTFALRGLGDPEARPGSLAISEIEVLAAAHGTGHEPGLSRHAQRHHPLTLVRRALKAAGLELADLLGQLPGARLERPPDDERHAKLLYFARRPRPPATTDGREGR